MGSFCKNTFFVIQGLPDASKVMGDKRPRHGADAVAAAEPDG
jgi:hypothetical protein